MRTQGIGTIHRRKSIWGKWNTKLEWSVFLKWHCTPCLSQAGWLWQSHSLKSRLILCNSGGIQGLWKVPDEQHLKWMGLFSYRICVGIADVMFSRQKVPLPTRRGFIWAILPFLCCLKACRRGWLGFWKMETYLKGSYLFSRVWKQLLVFVVDGGLPGRFEFSLKVLSALWTFRCVLSPPWVS